MFHLLAAFQEKPSQWWPCQALQACLFLTSLRATQDLAIFWKEHQKETLQTFPRVFFHFLGVSHPQEMCLLLKQLHVLIFEFHLLTQSPLLFYLTSPSRLLPLHRKTSFHFLLMLVELLFYIIVDLPVLLDHELLDRVIYSTYEIEYLHYLWLAPLNHQKRLFHAPDGPFPNRL